MNDRRRPLGFTLLIVVLLLPLLLWPAVVNRLTDMTGEHNTEWLMTLLFPAYAIASAYCAWRCYTQRRELSYILLAMLALAYGAMWLLIG